MLTRIGMVLPSTPEYLPYVSNYLHALGQIASVQIATMAWDRLASGLAGALIYSDGKRSHRRGVADHFRYSRFVARTIQREQYDVLIIFGIPMAFFLQNVLTRKYRRRFVFDIRDHHRLLHFASLGNVVRAAAFTSVSSPAFLRWLPTGGDYVLSHNAGGACPESLSGVDRLHSERGIVFSCIGALKDFAINRKLIDEVRNHPDIQLRFCGDGIINEQLIEYRDRIAATNVAVSGRYAKIEESGLYEAASAINMLMSAGSINNESCLSNRLYNAAKFGRPLVALRGSYMAEVIEKYSLGVVVTGITEVPTCLKRLDKTFDWDGFQAGRAEFLRQVADDNAEFSRRLRDWVTAAGGAADS